MKKKLCLLMALIAVLFVSAAFAQECEKEEHHRYGPWKTKTTATCTRQGHMFRYCQKCDHWEQRRTAKLPHTPGEMTVTKEPTCTEKGSQEAVCQVCNQVVRYSIDKLPHKDGELQVTKEPTCTANGTGEYVCADCGRAKKENISKLGHDWDDMKATKEPTCTAKGTGEKTCLRCGRVQTSTLERIEHAWGEWTVTREPEGKRKGLRAGECTVCGQKREEVFFWEGTLYEGMEPCQEVIRLQEQLRDLGFYKGSIRSGQYGDLTTSAVARFQRSVNLDGSGIADPQTQSMLNIAWQKATGKSLTLMPEEMEEAQQAKPME